jgi:hypothetical protein
MSLTFINELCLLVVKLLVLFLQEQFAKYNLNCTEYFPVSTLKKTEKGIIIERKVLNKNSV